MVVVVDDDALARRAPAAEEVVRREQLHAVAERQRPQRRLLDPVRRRHVAPVATAMLIEAVPERLLGRDGAAARDLDRREAPELPIRQSATRTQAAGPGSRASRATRPPSVVVASASTTS